jgi:hypothetical protein
LRTGALLPLLLLDEEELLELLLELPELEFELLLLPEELFLLLLLLKILLRMLPEFPSSFDRVEFRGEV